MGTDGVNRLSELGADLRRDAGPWRALELGADLDRLARSAGSEAPDLVHAAFAALLAHDAEGQTPTMGVLSGGAVVRFSVDLSGDPEFTEIVERVRAARPSGPTAVRAVEAQDSADGPPAEAMVLDTSASAISYRPDLLAPDEADRMAGRLLAVLTAVSADGKLSLSQLPVVSEQEQRELERWNDTVVEFASEAGVHELFEAQAARTPGAVAVSCGENSLTYAELDAAANRLARHLRNLGVRAETVVGVAVERGLDMVTTLLAIWKAGGAYLPLDPDYPADRLAYMASDSGARVVVGTGTSTVQGMDVFVRLDDPETAAAIASADPGAPQITTHPDQLAYVIYTSGSTGMPKGVQVGHRGVVNRLVRIQEDYDLAPTERVLHKTPLTFDASVWELFWPLSIGAELVLAEPGRHRDLDYLVALLESARIGIVHFVPSLFRLLVRHPALPALPALRLLFCSGEALAEDDVRRFYRRNDTTLVGNLYGPTEASIEASAAPYQRSDTGTPPIGSAIGNVRLHVLNAAMNPVPVGAAGELFIGGIGVGRGYVGRPDLTAERFPADPFTADGSRLYRTGDRVRRRADGQVEFLGRVDHQVKVRGVRIEPGEVEAALLAHPDVTDTVVVARADGGDRRLVAYVVGPAAALTASTLRAFLLDTLPAYLIPSAFVVLDQIPLSPNGKVDRSRLPAPSSARPALSSRYAEPSTRTEVATAAIWTEVLGLDAVGVHDDFFELGGHSLAATQVTSRIREAFEAEVALGVLFEHPTIARLAQAIDGMERRDPVPPVVPVDRGRALPLSFAQQRLWFLNQLNPESADYNEQLTLRWSGPLDVAALRSALEAIVERHEVLRTRLVAGHDGVAYQVVDESAAAARLEMVDLAGTDDPLGRARLQVAEDARAPFDLATGPLLRVRLFRLAADDHVLSLLTHHVVSDEWSVGILRRELTTLYTAFRDGRPSPLAPLKVQYADFARWQRDWLQGRALDRQLEHWRGRLAGAPALELPLDRPRPAVRSSVGARREFTIPPRAAAGLRELARASGATLFMVLFSSYAALLGRYTGQQDILVGTPIANRNRTETEDLIGFFVNTLVLRTDLSGDPTFAELVARVRGEALAAYAHQDLPFEKLVDALVRDRDRSRTPLFQALFNFNQDDAPDPDSGISQIEPTGDVAAKFDLRLIYTDSADGLTGAVEYSTALFDASTIERLVEHLLLLVSAVAQDSALPLSRISIRTAEDHSTLARLSGAAAAVPEAGGLHELITAQARRTPGTVALLDDSESLTYADLEARANRLARYLLSVGVGRETVVGLCLERSTTVIVAMLAVWKAGGAYLPLDPAHPADRLDHQLADSRAAIVLGEGDALDGPAGWTRKIDLDDPAVRSAIAASADTPPEVAVHPDQTAYVIYTSGSTGRPKGVWVTHRNLVSYTAVIPGRTGLGGEGRRYALLQPAATDFGNTVLFACLTTGGTLCPADGVPAADPAAVAGFLRDRAVDYLKIVPSHLAALTAGRPLAELMPARTLVLGGEAASPALIRALQAEAGDRDLVNHYGPTETTIGVITGPLGDGLGRALPNTRLHVLDQDLNPVPTGAIGELYIGGAGVARGYGNRPALTAERFVADPHAADGSRLYRTGDRVRAGLGGRLEFLGRADGQVKVRGHRIEPAEIEHALTAHPTVGSAAVLALTEAEDVRLVAYLTPADSGQGAAAAGDLRAFLRLTLPEHMIPGGFVELPALPLTANGKLDRAALPAPDRTGPQAADAPATARTPAEELLVGLWSDILGLDQVGAEDDFFDLGGHSLLATRLISRIRAVLGVELPLAALFDHPTARGIATVLGSAGPAGPDRPIVPVPRDRPLPLSFAQQRLWFLDQLNPGSTEYNNADAVRLSGHLDAEALRAALDTLSHRHEMLRTRLVTGPDGTPHQIVDPPSRFAFELTEAASADEAHDLVTADAAVPFDLAAGPLVRARLIRLADDDHVFALYLHHVVSDEWSALVLRRELADLYDGLRRGDPPRLPAPAVQYADFAVWQRDLLQGELLDRQLAYWRDRLAALPALDLATDHPRPPVRSSAGAVVDFTLPAPTAADLRAVARQTGATEYMTLLAAFAVLLGRYTGQDDIVLGTPIANRTRAETEGVIGFFVNSLVARTDLSGDPSFAELVGRVRRGELDDFAHQDVPFEQLVDLLQPDRDRSRTPLFQVLFSTDRIGEDRLAFAGTQARPFAAGAVEARFDLTLTVAGESGSFLYSTELFDRPTVERLARQFTALLGELAGQPDRRISQTPLAGLADLPGETGAATPIPDAGVHDLIAARALARPDAPAVVLDDRTLSYAELDRRANRFARYLRGLGVGPEVVVGLCLERGADLLVALLGVLKAGGAYLPIDPDLPAERVTVMLADSRASVLVGRSQVLDQLTTGRTWTVALDDPEIEAEIAACPDTDPRIPVRPDQLAYVIYTSGSTGVPKGIAVCHRDIVALVTSGDYADVGPDDVVAQGATVSFDAATFEIWGALANGASLVVLDRETLLSPQRLGRELQQRGVTVLFLTTALFNRLAADAPQALSGVGQLLFGGEAVDPPSVRRVLDLGRPRRLVHVYGPTEATTFATWHPVPADQDGAGRTVPIGGPLANTRLLVLDPTLARVPVGVPGELYLGGAGIARGYVRRPDLTAERFVADPHAADGSRLYRTGDRVRRLPDGALEFLGRFDQQVKIRGFRIEPAEIETALAGHPLIAEAAVVARDHGSGRRLVAYVVPADPAQGMPPAEELRAHLLAVLPAYFVPARFVELAALPLNRNGKVDHAVLPEPQDGRDEQAAGFTPPQTPTEQNLARLWAEVLHLGRVGADENFFDLGGHSLLATQVVSALRSQFGVDLTLAALFDHPTVRAFAAVVDAAAPGTAGPAITVAARDGALPLSFAQQRLWFLDQLEPGSAEYNVPVTLRLRGPLDTVAVRAALDEVVARHEVLRTRLVTVDGAARQVIDPSGGSVLETVDLTADPDPQAAALAYAAAEASTPFTLGTDRLIRARLLTLAPDDHLLCLVLHHVVSDEWSAGVLRRELAQLYADFTAGRSPSLPPLPIQYADFAVWQRTRLQGEILDRQLAYWREQLAAAGALELPADRPRPPVRSSAGALVEFAVPEQTAAALRALSQRCGTTMFMTLLAAFTVLLGRYADQDDVLVGTPIANRNRSETEGLIGFFVNTLVLRTDLSGDPAFDQVVARVRETALGAYAHQDLPFEQLVDGLQPHRDRSRTPLFQVYFNHLGAAGGPDAGRIFGAGVAEEAVGLPHTTAKFDLTLFTEAPDGQGIRGTFEYSTDLFDRPTIERLARWFTDLLGEAAAAPGRRTSELARPTAGERDQVVSTWNDTARPIPPVGGVHELIAAAAARHPDLPAAVCAGAALTYRELDERANRVAHVLRGRGVGPETVVGLCLDEGPDRMVALVAIWKAGGAYLPLDPRYPAARSEFLVQDSGAALVIARDAEQWPGIAVLGPDDPAIDAAPATDPGGATAPGQLAYVIYTSGSTGRPKAVQAAHEGFVNRLQWMQDQYRLAPGERVLHKTAVTFDVSLWELVWPLTVGGCVVLADATRRADVDYLVELIEAEQVAVTHFVPSLFHQFVEHEWSAPMSDLRLVVCSGEALAGRDVRRFYQRHPAVVDNLYGPTEASIDVSCWSCPRPGDAGAPPIGRPIANTRMYVLDRRLQPVAAGMPGELYLGGVGLARGYGGRPDLTAERFVPDPIAADGSRLYRTGDRARWRADGQVDYLGRTDQQVKVRGFRIEPGEVEAALTAHPGLLAAAVIASADRRLVGYLVPGDREQGIPPVGELRAFLGRTLPDYMVPAVFVELAALPLSGNGKLDRAALPPPEAARPEPTAAYVPARTPVEEVLAAIWAEVLGLPRVGVTDNFFELGGDSIISIQAVSRARRAGLHLTPGSMFQHQTIAELAAVSGRPAHYAPAEQGPVTGAVPTTPIQRAFVERDLPDRDHYNQSRLLEVRSPADPDVLNAALSVLEEHHDALRSRLDGENLTIAAPEPADLLTIVDLTGLDEPAAREAVTAAATAAQTSLSLARGPLWRAVLFDHGDGGQRLYLVVHHLAVDAVSWQILIEDLETVCGRLERGLPPGLPAKTTSFKQWAQRLAELAPATERTEADHWLSAAGPTRIPRDHPDGENGLRWARSVTGVLPADQTDRLLRTAPAAAGAQAHEILLAALVLTLAQWAGAATLPIDLEGHGREDVGPDVDVTRTVGWFTTLFPVVVPLDGLNLFDLDAALRQTVDRVRAVPRRGLGHGLIRHLTDGDVGRALRQLPAAEVSFNYLGRADQPTAGQGRFRPLADAPAADRARSGRRAHLVELDCRVISGRLELVWTHSERVHDPSTIDRLSEQYLEILTELIDHCCAAQARSHTPSDFPLADLDQETLDLIQQRLGGIS